MADSFRLSKRTVYLPFMLDWSVVFGLQMDYKQKAYTYAESVCRDYLGPQHHTEREMSQWQPSAPQTQPLLNLLRTSCGSNSSSSSSAISPLRFSRGQSPISTGRDSRRFPLISSRTSWARLATLELRNDRQLFPRAKVFSLLQENSSSGSVSKELKAAEKNWRPCRMPTSGGIEVSRLWERSRCLSFVQ